MQVTLVAYYGPKPAELSSFIRGCQGKVAEALSSGFRPYDIEQVHGTMIGLEGIRTTEGVLNWNFRDRRGEDRMMNLGGVLDFLRSTEMRPMQIRIGGFRCDKGYGFTSRGQHPYCRSFSVQGEIAVAMGWPVDGDKYPETLDLLRREFQKYNVLHKWHKEPTEKDNDFYFVLGRVDRGSVKESLLQEVEGTLRGYLAGVLPPLDIPIGKQQLSVVAYPDDDPQLPPTKSVSFSPTDPQLSGDQIQELY